MHLAPGSRPTHVHPGWPLRTCIVQPTRGKVSETFIRAHAERLPGEVSVVHDFWCPSIEGEPVLSQRAWARALRKARRTITGRPWNAEITGAFTAALRRLEPDVVLAEYGTMGAAVLEACVRTRTPLVVHFHGYDATVRSLLAEHAAVYRRMFGYASGVIAVSTPMRGALESLGAPPARILVNPCGVDVEHVLPAAPGAAAPVFVGVGRFIPKKAPHLTVLAFAEMHRAHPDARLVLIGDGPLLPLCRDIVHGLGLAAVVSLPGAQPHTVVLQHMRSARAYVQHSVQADDGDCEGTPVAVLEAGASGLPVVSTFHGGIPAVVVDGETGLLTEERDVRGMAAAMSRLAMDPATAASMGTAARARIVARHSMETSIRGLAEFLEVCARRRPAARPRP